MHGIDSSGPLAASEPLFDLESPGLHNWQPQRGNGRWAGGTWHPIGCRCAWCGEPAKSGESAGAPCGEERPRVEGPPQGAPSLEYSDNNSPPPESRAKPSASVGCGLEACRRRLFGEGCRSHWCPSCCRKAGVELYRAVIVVIVAFAQGRLLMLTLTVDRSKYSCPEEAFDHLNRRVSRLFDKLRRRGINIGRWFKVMEFHSDPEGWPHWHILVECDFIPHALLQSLWVGQGGGPIVWIGKGPKPKPGQKSKPFANRKHAAAYLLKYVCKAPKETPHWVLCRKRPLRRYDTSKGFYDGGKQRAARRSAEEVAACKAQQSLKCKRHRNDWTCGHRRSLCGARAVCIEERRVRGPDGHVIETRRHIATLDCGVDDVLTLASLPPRECFEGHRVCVPAECLSDELLLQLESKPGQRPEEPPWSPYLCSEAELKAEKHVAAFLKHFDGKRSIIDAEGQYWLTLEGSSEYH